MENRTNNESKWSRKTDQKRIKHNDEKNIENDAKMDPNMEQTGSQKRAKTPTSSRHIPDTTPRREKGAKMEPTWSQKGAQREPKTMENQ